MLTLRTAGTGQPLLRRAGGSTGSELGLADPGPGLSGGSGPENQGEGSQSTERFTGRQAVWLLWESQ